MHHDTHFATIILTVHLCTFIILCLLLGSSLASELYLPSEQSPLINFCCLNYHDQQRVLPVDGRVKYNGPL